MVCIICDKENNSKSIEHIVSESFGNKNYVMPVGSICDDCNARFSKFESVALGNSVWVMERSRFGIESKKGKNAKGKVGGLEISGHKNFVPNIIDIKGLTPENLKNFDPKTLIGELFIPSFDKSEVAASKLLLKIGIESIYKSQRKLFEESDFSLLKRYMTGVDNIDWPFITSNIELGSFKGIPSFTDKYNLAKCYCKLTYLREGNTLLFIFQYGAVSMIINLLNRDLSWIGKYLEADNLAVLYPEHYRKKLSRLRVTRCDEYGKFHRISVNSNKLVK